MVTLSFPLRIIQRITGYESPSKAKLSFDVTQKDARNFLVSVHVIAENTENPVKLKDISNIDRYGGRIQVGENDYPVKTEDFETLLSILDRSPKFTEDGSLIFEIFPPELEYLRERKNVAFSENVKELSVSEEEAEPAVEVEYDPEEGVEVKPGYQTDSSEEVKESEELTDIGNGWLRFGNEFYKKPDVAESTDDFLNQSSLQIDLKDVPEFFLRDLALLDSEMTTVLTDKAKEVNVVDSTPEPTVSVNKSSKGWLDFDIEYEVKGHQLSQQELSQRISKKDGSDFQRLDDNTWVKVDEEKIEKYNDYLEDIGAKKTDEGYRVEASKYRSLEEFIEDIGGNKKASKAYQDFLYSLGDFDPNPNFSLDKLAEERLKNHGIILRNYQRKGASWLHWLQQNRLHGILADEMGLGKTIQALAAMKKAYEKENVQRPSLIISPKSVIGHWKKEAEKVFDPEKHQIRIYHGQNRRPEVFYPARQNLFISTYATIRNDVEKIATYPLFYLILDEATKIKNRQAKRTKATKALNSAHRLALSGTPIENRTSELWSIFDFLMKDHLGTHADFQRNFATPLEENRNTKEGEEALKELQDKIQPFFTRRDKSKVAQELPEKITNEYFVELTEEQKSIYGQIQDRFKSLDNEDKENFVGSILPILTKLKQTCIHPSLINSVDGQKIMSRSNKFDSVVERVEEIVNEGDQAVIFTQYIKPLDLLGEVLSQKNIRFIRIDGSTQNRQMLIDRFETDNIDVALCSVKATEHGINLQTANHVLHMDFWWNPATERQATARVHRLGQEKTVQVHKFYVENTLEEKIKEMLEEKQELADQVFKNDVSFLSSLNRDELLDILKR